MIMVVSRTEREFSKKKSMVECEMVWIESLYDASAVGY